MTKPIVAIHLPVMVVRCGNRLIETLPKEFRSKIRPLRGGGLLCPYASTPRLQMTDLIDRKGYHIRLIPRRQRRAFLRWFCRVIDFTKMECAIETDPLGTVADMAKRAKAWKNSSGRAFRRFLAKQDPETAFDESLFRRAWEATYIELPESDWQQVFKLKP